jgi:hypothetical protein
MRTALAALLGFVVSASAIAPAVWNPPAWVAENTVELRTTDPGGEPHWFKVWHVVLDGQLYVRLGSRAAGRFDRNVSKPVMGVRIAGNTFERVRGVLAPEMTERVTAAMKDKYWTQADFIVRRMNHPYTMRLEPEPEG